MHLRNAAGAFPEHYPSCGSRKARLMRPHSCPARTPPFLALMQPTSGFDYSAEAYIAALNQFVAAVGLSGQQFAVIVHGFVLGQYGLLWALENDGGPLLLPPPLLCLLLCLLLLVCCCCSSWSM